MSGKNKNMVSSQLLKGRTSCSEGKTILSRPVVYVLLTEAMQGASFRGSEVTAMIRHEEA